MSANVETAGFVGRVLGGRWVVGEQLGSGSFGVVHAGVEHGSGNAVAVKLLHPQFLHHGETIARFWNEAEALRRMNHPNVLVLLDVGVAEDGVPYLVTELLTGETLRDLLNREGPLPAERAMRLLGPAAHALHHAHLAGIVHRDLKPENIFRVRKDGMGTTKILDFGVAKLLDTSPGRKLSQTGIMIGTMAYSPPEQMQGLGDIDHRADQFGFAALFFEALTGQRPFPHSQPFALFQAILNGPRPRASTVRPGVPPSVDDVLIRGLDPDRTRRFATVEEFYLALSAALTTPAFAGMSTTFSGAKPIALPNANTPLPPQMYPPPVQPTSPPPAGYAAHGQDASMRFRAIDEELTRSDVAPSEQRNPLNTTLDTGVRPEIPSVNTTLVEGKTPQHIVDAIKSASPPPNSAPPASFQRPIAAPEAGAVTTERKKPSRAPLLAVAGALSIAVLIAVFLLLFHH